MRSKKLPQRAKTNKLPAQEAAASWSDWFGMVFCSLVFCQIVVG